MTLDQRSVTFDPTYAENELFPLNSDSWANHTMTRRNRLAYGSFWGFLVISLGFLVTTGFAGGKEESPAIMTFTEPPQNTTPFRFSFAVYGDIQENYKNSHQDLVAQMMEEELSFVINTGDISRNGGKDYQENFFPVIRELAAKKPFFPAVGNHDVSWDSSVSRRRFLDFFQSVYDYLGESQVNWHLRESDGQRAWYSFEYGEVLFIVLDSNFFIDEGRYDRTHDLEVYQDYGREQLAWVREVLEQSSRQDRFRAKFVVFHHSPFVSDQKHPLPLLGIGGHPGHVGMVVNETIPGDGASRSSYLLDLFREHRVTAVFTGHEHYYERWRETIFENGSPVHVLNWVVTGLGGTKPRGRPDYEQEEIQELFEPGELYREYQDRISHLSPDLSAELAHVFPNEEQHSGRFHHYILVTVDGTRITFKTRDRSQRIQDQGAFSLEGSGLAE